MSIPQKFGVLIGLMLIYGIGLLATTGILREHFGSTVVMRAVYGYSFVFGLLSYCIFVKDLGGKK